MPNQSQSERLNRAIDALLSRTDAPVPRDPALAALTGIAAELRALPSQTFRIQLGDDLRRRGEMATRALAMEARQTATLYLCVDNAPEAIEFYKRAFGAREEMRIAGPGGRIGHAELRIGNSAIMLADEFPDYGALAPPSVGGSPVRINLNVDNVDAVVERAVGAGAKIVRPVQDQFYGERSGQILDPYGYTWVVSTTIEQLTAREIQQRAGKWTVSAGQPAGRKGRVRPGFRTMTPYIVVERADLAIDFLKAAFGAEETFRAVGSAGGYHCEMRLEDSMLMIGGGAPELEWRGESRPMAFHVYVPDADAAYERALAAGGQSVDEPSDRPYGERSATVEDSNGNRWYIARRFGAEHRPEGYPAVQPYLHPLRAEPVIRFLKRAFGAQELGRHESPAGELYHATFRIGTSHFEMGEAGGAYPNMPGTFYLYVEDADALYSRALAAGATSLYPVADQPYGDRNGGVKDKFGNIWYIGTNLQDTGT